MAGRADRGRVSEVTPLIKSDQTGSSGCCRGFGKRHVLAAISCSGFMIVYALRVNLSVALVAMINNTDNVTPSGFNDTSDDQCPNLEPENKTYSWEEGVTYPAMYSLWSKWAPNLERSFLMAASGAGAPIGTVLAFPISGLLCEYGFSGGWPSVFYIFGSAGCVWFVFWSILAYNSPADHPTISAEERHYIESSVGDTSSKTNIQVPWKHIILSVPVNALNVTIFCSGWGFYTILTSLPTYMKSILKLDMTQNGLISALPYVVNLILTVFSGYLADFLRRRRIFSTTTTRKILTALGLFVPAGVLVAITLVGCDRPIVILLLTISVGLGGMTAGGYSINQLDLAPEFSGIIMGISNTFGTIAGIVAPFVAGVLTNNGQSRQEWNTVFLVSAAVSTLGVIVFTLLGSGEEQPWAISKAPENVKANSSNWYDDTYEDIPSGHSYHGNYQPSYFDNPFDDSDLESRKLNNKANVNI